MKMRTLTSECDGKTPRASAEYCSVAIQTDNERNGIRSLPQDYSSASQYLLKKKTKKAVVYTKRGK